MTTRRLGAAAIIVASLMAGTACQGGGNDFDPDGAGYLELACSIDRHQRDLTASEIVEDGEVERQLAYAAADALLASGNEDRDPDLRQLSDDLQAAIGEGDVEALDVTRDDLDARCEDDDLSVDDADDLVDIACSVADVLEPGRSPELLLISSLIDVAAAKDGEHDDLAEAASFLLIDPDDAAGPDHPDEAAIKDFRDECP